MKLLLLPGLVELLDQPGAIYYLRGIRDLEEWTMVTKAGGRLRITRCKNRCAIELRPRNAETTRTHCVLEALVATLGKLLS